MKYVLTWAGTWGPKVEFFESARDLLAFASGFSDGKPVLIVSPYEVRA